MITSSSSQYFSSICSSEKESESDDVDGEDDGELKKNNK